MQNSPRVLKFPSAQWLSCLSFPPRGRASGNSRMCKGLSSDLGVPDRRLLG